jgi:hypothetical protein
MAELESAQITSEEARLHRAAALVAGLDSVARPTRE